jgi:hypothetical protein
MNITLSFNEANSSKLKAVFNGVLTMIPKIRTFGKYVEIQSIHISQAIENGEMNPYLYSLREFSITVADCET